MRKQTILYCLLAVVGVLSSHTAKAQKTQLERVHENIRTTPYPQQENELFLNPSPLIVPATMREATYLQFALSQDENFAPDKTIQSDPLPWCMFNPHQVLNEGSWYWRFRSVDEKGNSLSWSPVYSFKVTPNTPQFVTPGFATFAARMPQGYPRIYCFLEEGLRRAMKSVQSHPEYKDMINRAGQAMSTSYEKEQKPFDVAGKMGQMANYLYTAYCSTGEKMYADKMLAYTQALLAADFTIKQPNDFYCGDVLFLLTHTYDVCYNELNDTEKEELEKLIFRIASFHHSVQRKGWEENHLFNNHYWQRGFREMLQIGLLLADKHEQAREMLEYCYELWTARAPASGFNQDGEWHNGQGYFEANTKSLWYVPALFGYVTGTDFLQHPWYRNAGRAMAYAWPPRTQSAGFGDGNERQKIPNRQRVALADYLARETGDPYAVWYSNHCNNYKSDFDMRLYRMARTDKTYPTDQPLPVDASPAVWFEDCGEMMAHSNLSGYRENLFLSFRSSPFGAGSHTLADQNSFNLHYRGVPIYRSTGYYLHFSDAHNIMSYRHTRAHNTILIDGIGQAFTTKAYGKITRMLNGKNISYALGDASNAYDGISEYPLWENNFKAAGLEQSAENGFGKTALKTYRRHLFLLHPDIVVIYDELEAEKPVRWDWLLHSPIPFSINEKERTLTTRNEEKKFSSVAQLFSNSACNIQQTNLFAVAPDLSKAKGNVEYPNQWHVTAGFEASSQNRILTIVRVQPDGKSVKNITRNGNDFRVGSWVIHVELDPAKDPELQIRNTKTDALFNYGNKMLKIEETDYQREKGSSVLYDEIDGEWVIHEMSDYEPRKTSN